MRRHSIGFQAKLKDIQTFWWLDKAWSSCNKSATKLPKILSAPIYTINDKLGFHIWPISLRAPLALTFRTANCYLIWRSPLTVVHTATAVYKAESRRLSRLLVRLSRRQYESKLADDVQSNPRRFFAHVRRNRRLQQRIVALRVDDGAVVTDSQNMAGTLTNYYASVYRTDEGSRQPL